MNKLQLNIHPWNRGYILLLSLFIVLFGYWHISEVYTHWNEKPLVFDKRETSSIHSKSDLNEEFILGNKLSTKNKFHMIDNIRMEELNIEDEFNIVENFNINKNYTINDFKMNKMVFGNMYRNYKDLGLKSITLNRISRNNFQLWLKEQMEISFNSILQNIGDKNLSQLNKKYNVFQGSIIASPSMNNPNYFYHWIRDGAIAINILTKQLIIDHNYENEFNFTLAGTILKYLNASYNLQRTDNLSGSFKNLSNLGEPKWNVNNEPFMEDWGRPQNDGPALRLITIFNFLKMLKMYNFSLCELIKTIEKKEVLNLPFKDETSLYKEIIYYDLKFIKDNWFGDNFDLWEEIKSKHFFTLLCQLKSMKLGVKFLKEMKTIHEDNNYILSLEKEINKLSTYLTTEGGFQHKDRYFIVETPSILDTRGGLDIAVIIASILTHDDNDDNENDAYVPFDVDNQLILNTLQGLIKEMKVLYPINHYRAKLNQGIALGRYPEDLYDGNGTSEGNPWFLATSAASELLYKFIIKLYSKKQNIIIPLNPQKSTFWSLILNGNYHSNDYQGYIIIPFGSNAFKQVTSTIFKYSDSFLDNLREHVSDLGEMSEQFNKYNGYMEGASQLTWSHSALWNALCYRIKAKKIM